MADEALDSSRIEAAKEIALQEEGPRRRLEGITGWLAAGLAVAMSLLFIYWAWATVTAQMLRLVFLLFSLVLSFLLYPATRKGRLQGVPWFDWLLIGLSSSPSVTRCGISKSSSTAQRCLPIDGPDSRRADDFAGVGGDAPDNRMDLACRCFIFLAYAWFGPGCRRPGPTEAMA